MKNKRVAIIGHFGAGREILDGQTIKTRVLYDELKKTVDWEIQKVDTYYRKRNPLKLIYQSLRSMVTARDIIVLLSGNGMRVFFPVLTILVKLFGIRIYHDVIGGNLVKYIDKYPRFQSYLNSFRINWVETERMKAELEAAGLSNVEVLPNFKRLNVVREEELQMAVFPPYRFCTFSRVMKEKGIEDAINAVKSLNAKAECELCTLDIYGAVDASYKAEFEERLLNAGPVVRYKGQVPYDKSVEALKGYYSLLFPTRWEGEGFAGTIVDAFSAGLPVIATDWRHNSDIVTHGVNGILYPGEMFDCLEDAMSWAMGNPQSVEKMKRQCVCSARFYQPETCICKVIDCVEQR